MPLGDKITLLDQIEKELVDALEPMLVPVDVDGLKQIAIEPFSTGDDIVDLLQKFRSRLPGAFLNLPQIDYLSDGALTVADLTLNYAFLVAVENVRAKTIDKKTLAYYFHDKFHAEFFYRKINNDNCAIPANLDYIRPLRFEVAEAEGTMVTLTTFSIKVRNWIIREHER